MKCGLERLIEESALRRQLRGLRIALLANPASVTADLTHVLDALSGHDDIHLSAAFGPQHGLRGETQDNMVEWEGFTDAVTGVPVFSLRTSRYPLAICSTG